MNLKEQLAEKQSALLALKEGIEAGDEKAIKEAAEIAEAIDAIQESIAEAAKAQAILSALSAEQQTNENPEKEEKPMKNLGEFAIKSFDGKARQGERVNLAAEYKAATDTQTLPAAMAGLTTYYDPNIVEAYKPRPNVIGLFGRETISGNALTFYVESEDVDGAVTQVAEGAQKPQVHFADPTPVTVSLQKIAAFVKESDELLEDMPRLASVIENRLVYLHDLAREEYAISTLGNTSGIQADTITPAGTAASAVELADGIYKAISSVQNQTGFAADAVVMNPADFMTLALGRDGNDQYYGGGYFGGAYGNGSYGATPTVWGIPVVLTASVGAGTIYVGAFRMGAAVVEKGGIRVEMTNSDQNDFIRNIVTIRCESRMALAVRYPAAFVKVEVSGSL